MLRFASCHLPSEFQHRIRINTDTVLSFEYIQYIHKTKYFWGLLHFQVMQSILWFDALPVSGGAHNRCGVTPNRTGKQACKTCRCLQQSLLSAWATSIPIKISLLKIVWFSLPAPSFSGNKLSLKKKKKSPSFLLLFGVILSNTALDDRFLWRSSLQLSTPLQQGHTAVPPQLCCYYSFMPIQLCEFFTTVKKRVRFFFDSLTM